MVKQIYVTRDFALSVGNTSDLAELSGGRDGAQVKIRQDSTNPVPVPIFQVQSKQLPTVLVASAGLE